MQQLDEKKYREELNLLSMDELSRILSASNLRMPGKKKGGDARKQVISFLVDKKFPEKAQEKELRKLLNLLTKKLSETSEEVLTNLQDDILQVKRLLEL